MTMRRRIDVNLDELDQIIDRSRHAPLSESEGQKLKTALHAMAEGLARKRSTEKTSAVLPQSVPPVDKPEPGESAPARVMGAMAPQRLPAPIGLPSHTPRCIPATAARSAAREESTARKSRPRW